MKKALFLALIILGIASCKKDSEDTSVIQQINYGTSFGMCVGYCKKEMALDSGKVIFKRSGWNNTVVPTSCELTQSKSVLDSLSKKLNADGFFKMQEVWGCPDCADGGAEWIELTLRSGKKHKVTFEYLNEHSALKSILVELRIKLNKTPWKTIVENVK